MVILLALWLSKRLLEELVAAYGIDFLSALKEETRWFQKWSVRETPELLV